LYRHTQRESNWATIVERLTTDFVDHKTNAPISDNPDKEEHWGLVTDYRVELARKVGNWALAERLQQLHIDWDRRYAAGLLDRPPESLDEDARSRIQDLASSIMQLGSLLREQGKADCLHPYQVALELNERIGNHRGTALTAFQLGQAYQDLPDLRDFEKAKDWYQKAFALLPPEEVELRAKIRHWLGLANEKTTTPPA